MNRKLLLIPAIAVALALGGVAYASIPASNGTVDGCYSNSTHPHELFVIQSGNTCPSGYTSIDWSQAGPAGPQGATGATGPAGSGGGLTWYSYSQNYVSQSSSSDTSEPATETLDVPACPAGGVDYASEGEVTAASLPSFDASTNSYSLGASGIGTQEDDGTSINAGTNDGEYANNTPIYQGDANTWTNLIYGGVGRSASVLEENVPYTVTVWYECLNVTNPSDAPPAS